MKYHELTSVYRLTTRRISHVDYSSQSQSGSGGGGGGVGDDGGHA